MSALMSMLAEAPSDRILFAKDGAMITAGAVRAAARIAAGRLAAGDGPIFLHTDSAALLSAGLIAGASLGRAVAILPHAQPAYLSEIGAGPGSFLSDQGAAPALTLPDVSDGPHVWRGADDPAMIFFTSGSTGAPKQTPKRLSQIEAEAQFWIRWLPPAVDNVAGSVSHQHIYGLLFRVAVPLLAGWRSTDRAAFSWEEFAAELTRSSLAVTSPAHLTRLPPGLNLAESSPAIVLSSGQALPFAAACDAAAVFGEPPLEILGSTETGGVAMRRQVDGADPWTPLHDVTIALNDDGVLSVASPHAGQALQPMGDRAELLEDGRFRLLARADRVVKVEGKRVSLTRVEAALSALPSVEDVAALALKSGDAGGLGAVIVLSQAGKAELARLGVLRFTRALRRSLAEGLEPAERPKRWRFVDEIPVNSQGKRLAATLAKLFAPPDG